MSEAYKVLIKSSDGRDQATSLQVIAGSPEEAARAARERLGEGVIVEVDNAPLTLKEAVKADLVSGKVLLS